MERDRSADHPPAGSRLLVDGRPVPFDELVEALQRRDPRLTGALVRQLRRDRAGSYASQEALAAAIAAFGPGVSWYLNRHHRLTPQEHESAYNRTLARFAMEIDRFEPHRAALTTWLLSLADNAARHELEPGRKRRRQQAAAGATAPSSPPSPGDARRPALGICADRLATAMLRLSPAKRRILYGRAVLERSFPELARTERRTVAAIEQAYYRALREVRAAYLDGQPST